MFHSFNTKIAKKYGVNSAVLLNHLYFWISKNKANGTNYYDNNYWTYNSTKAFKELFEYMTQRQVDYALKKLIDNGLVITGNYNKVAYDRTLWYAITKKGYSILQNCEMELTKLQNGVNEIVKPIPDINTDINTDNNTGIVKAVVSYLNEKTNRDFKSTTNSTKSSINARIKEGFKLEDFKRVIDIKTQQWLNDKKMAGYLRPQTLFGTKFESYLNEAPKTVTGKTQNKLGVVL